MWTCPGDKNVPIQNMIVSVKQCIYNGSLWSKQRICLNESITPSHNGLLHEYPSIHIKHVSVKGFEPPTPCSQGRCATQTALHGEILLLVGVDGFEPPTSCVKGNHSTTELYPYIFQFPNLILIFFWVKPIHYRSIVLFVFKHPIDILVGF